MTYSLFLAGKLTNPLNARKHWRVIAASTKEWRRRTADAAVLAHWPKLFPDPVAPKRITLHAQLWSPFDDDEASLRACLKSLIDGLGPSVTQMRKGREVYSPGARIIHTDAKGCGHLFVYEQSVNRKNLGVRVTVELIEGGAQ